ncbi:MAG: TraM recognition domain-containing protein [Phycisphaerae bacterium]|jgi:hypothetical protein|nr:TraM recognition domain-containing protein [Phycisphaerae bacterium]
MVMSSFRRFLRRTTKREVPALAPFDSRTPLIRWSESDVFRIANACEGTAIFGSTGSGKSSGSARQLALSMLRAGSGGLVLSAKNERDTWIELCAETGRSSDLLIFEPNGEWAFDPFDFEMRRGGRGSGSVENVISLLSTLVSFAERGAGGKGGSGREGEDFWRRAMQEMLRNFAWLLYLATGTVTLDGLCEAINSAPQSPEQVGSESWKSWSGCFALLAEADTKIDTPAKRRELVLVTDYVLRLFPALSERTRSVIVTSFTSLADVLRRGRMHQLFGGRSSMTPEYTEEGSIILVDVPVLEYGVEGLLANAIMKHCWCQWIQRRSVVRSPRPVFLFSDEGHHFVTPEDALFQTTCRASRVATVLITQSIANLRTALGGGETGRETADALLANLNTRIFHANGDPTTNEYAANLIGKRRELLMNGGDSRPQGEWASEALGLGAPGQVNAGFSEHWDHEVRPESFPLLRTGGVEHGGLVDAIVVRNGGVFRDTNKVWRKATFRQAPLPFVPQPSSPAAAKGGDLHAG